MNNVIHVAFGSGGGRIPPGVQGPAVDAVSPKGREAPAHDATPTALPAAGNEPVTELFSRRQVAKLLGISETALRSLDRASVVSPSGTRSGRPAYTFQDLIALRATRDLLQHRVRLRDVAKAIGVLRASLPRVTRPLQELRIVSDGRRVVVRTEGHTFEPLTGQMVLDFQVQALREDVVRMLHPEGGTGRARTAYDLYAQASALDEDPATFDQAEELYRRAVQLDPSLAIAYTNLGNIRFRRGDEPGAEVFYRRALDVDPAQPEAHYNLGYVMLERGHARDAAAYFERAIESDPRFADAHFNLAMAYEQLGERVRARTHWKRYLEIEPTGRQRPVRIPIADSGSGLPVPKADAGGGLRLGVGRPLSASASASGGAAVLLACRRRRRDRSDGRIENDLQTCRDALSLY
jgi:DNA-binding transcriptional MerR regulator